MMFNTNKGNAEYYDSLYSFNISELHGFDLPGVASDALSRGPAQLNPLPPPRPINSNAPVTAAASALSAAAAAAKSSQPRGLRGRPNAPTGGRSARAAHGPGGGEMALQAGTLPPATSADTTTLPMGPRHAATYSLVRNALVSSRPQGPTGPGAGFFAGDDLSTSSSPVPTNPSAPRGASTGNGPLSPSARASGHASGHITAHANSHAHQAAHASVPSAPVDDEDQALRSLHLQTGEDAIAFFARFGTQVGSSW
jgi:hypothetical protein